MKYIINGHASQCVGWSYAYGHTFSFTRQTTTIPPREQLERMTRSRAKYERVLESENIALHHTRASSEKHQISNLRSAG